MNKNAFCLFKDLIYIYTYITLTVLDIFFVCFTGPQHTLGSETQLYTAISLPMPLLLLCFQVLE
jgi:hypothetical protein